MKYKVTRDRQGGAFGTGREYTADEWIEQARAWAEVDNDTDLDNELERMQKHRDEWTDQEVIGFIGEIWDLDIEEVK